MIPIFGLCLRISYHNGFPNDQQYSMTILLFRVSGNDIFSNLKILHALYSETRVPALLKHTTHVLTFKRKKRAHIFVECVSEGFLKL